MRSFSRNLRRHSRFRRNKRNLHDTTYQGDGKILKHGWSMIAAFTNTKDAVMRKPFLLNRHHRYRVCCCSVNCVVAFRYAIASDHCVIVDQPTEMMATYKAPLPVEQWDAI